MATATLGSGPTDTSSLPTFADLATDIYTVNFTTDGPDTLTVDMLKTAVAVLFSL